MDDNIILFFTKIKSCLKWNADKSKNNKLDISSWFILEHISIKVYEKRLIPKSLPTCLVSKLWDTSVIPWGATILFIKKGDILLSINLLVFF